MCGDSAKSLCLLGAFNSEDGASPRLAIILDDLGENDRAAAHGLLAICPTADISVLPNTSELGTLSKRRTRAAPGELHLPMEP